jgi:hypothetical protein
LKLTFNEKIRIRLFRNEIESNKNMFFLKNLSDNNLIEVLNAAVLPNALSITAVKHSVIFNLIFQESSTKRVSLFNDIKYLYNFVSNLSKTEKVVIKYAAISRFTSKSWQKDFFEFLKNPLSLRKQSYGSKSMSQKKFKEYYFFSKNLVSRGIKNERLPRL